MLELDVLITARNVDVKTERVRTPDVEHWLYALVALQTTQGFLGAGNYGIARMNGGFASRPCVAFAPAEGSAPRFVRDVHALLGERERLCEGHGFNALQGCGLLWCAPWDGTHSLGLHELDPFFIEVCRRLRVFVGHDGALKVCRGATKVARIEAGECHGNTGDAWTPVDHDKGKALTVAESGFSYQLVQELLFGPAWRQGAAGALRSEDGDRLWVGQVLVRGQGKTGGYHERWLPVPPRARLLLGQPDERARLGERARAWVERAKDMRLKILKPALLTLLQGAPDKLKFDDDRADALLAHLDGAIDGSFFPMLFEQADAPPEVADTAFEKHLVALAQVELDAARDSLPVPAARRWKAEAAAERTFLLSARKHFKLAFPASEASAPSATEQGEST